MDIQQDFVQR